MKKVKDRVIGKKILVTLNCISGIGAVFIVWFLVTTFTDVSESLLPSPIKVFGTMWEMISNGELLKHSIASLVRVVKGFLIAFCIAIPTGMVMGMWNRARRALEALIDMLRAIPPIAIIPLSILWFGIGEASKVFIIAFASFFPIVLNVFSGIQQVDKVHIRAAQTLGASKMQIFTNVIIRSAIPDIIVGMRSGVSMAIISLVAAELVAANSGLGFLISEARYLFRTDQVLVGIIVIGFLGFLINKLLILLEKKLIVWK